jgi:hypothetical protein
MSRPGWRRSYYEWLGKYDTSPHDSYAKPWLSTATAGECAGAETLGDVMTEGGEIEAGRHRASVSDEASSLQTSMGHKFSVDLICSDCSRSWEDHQEIRSPCRGHELARYVEPRDAPKESEAERRKRVERFGELYPD